MWRRGLLLRHASSLLPRVAGTPAPRGVLGGAQHDVLSRLRPAGAVAHSTNSSAELMKPSKPPPPEISHTELTTWERRQGGRSHAFPDWIESWGRKPFYRLGTLGAVVAAGAAVLLGPTTEAAMVAAPVAAYWALGLADIRQTRHTIRRNFPVLGNVRYALETIRPEIRQYFVESDTETAPFSRLERSIVYQRSKGTPDSQSFGTRSDVYAPGYEWVRHSLHPKKIDMQHDHARVSIGGPHCAREHVYSASLLNVSGMSYGALSDNAILALNTAARLGGFYHNTGEGGVSRFHLAPGGDIVWNIGSGYFGCREADGSFSPARFAERAASPAVKMIELKLSQGAKPAHGGVLPGAKVTPIIAEARGVPVGVDCLSPLRHSAFSGPIGLIDFIGKLRELSGGKPVGFKLCVGDPVELCEVVRAMLESGISPDFITVDGGEGGTGAAPPEFSNSVGTPLAEGLTLLNDVLVGAGLRDDIRIIAAGKVLTGFSLVKTLALGADVCNAARAMMFALGCIQALKCGTNRCPTGVTTLDPELMAGLVPEDKALRVYRFHHATVSAALELIGAMGADSPADIDASRVMRRLSVRDSVSYADLYPAVVTGSLITGSAPRALQTAWDLAGVTMRVPHAAQDVKLKRQFTAFA